MYQQQYQHQTEKIDSCEYSDLVIRQIDQHWFLCLQDNIPHYQIAFISQYKGISRENLQKQFEEKKFISEKKWSSIQNFINNLYSDQDEKRISYLHLNSLQHMSQIAKFIISVINDDTSTINVLIENDELQIALLYYSIDFMSKKQITQSFRYALKAFTRFGFQNMQQQIPIIPLVNGFSLILALFDMFQKEHSQIINLIMKDMFFPGVNLQGLINAHLILHEEQERGKYLSVKFLRILLDRMKDMNAQKIKYSIALIDNFGEYLNKIDDDDLFQLNNKHHGQQKENQRGDIWSHLKIKIQNGAKLSKKEEEDWKELAFGQFHKESLLMIGEKSIIYQQKSGPALNAYKILYSCGDYQSLGVLYSLLCFEKQWDEALAIATKCKNNIKIANCFLKTKKIIEATEILKQNFLNRTKELENQNIQNSSEAFKKDITEEILTSYFLIKGTYITEQKRFLGALTAYEILRRDNKNEKVSLILKIMLISKLVERGIFFEMNHTLSRKLLKFLKKHYKPVYLYEFISSLFLKRKLNQQNLNLNDSKQKKQKSPKKKQKNSVDIQKWQVYVENLLNVDIAHIYEYIESYLQVLKKESVDQSFTSKLREQSLILYKLGHKTLFHSDNEYKKENFEQNQQHIIIKCRKNLLIYGIYKAETPLNFFQFLGQDANTMNLNREKSDIDLLLLQNKQNKQQQESSQRIFDFQINELGFPQFKGNVVNKILPRFEINDTVLDENKKFGYFTFNNQIFQVENIEIPEQEQAVLNIAKTPSPFTLNVYGIIEDKFLLTETHNFSLKEFMDSGFQINNHLQFLTQLVGIVSGLQIANLSGIFSMFGFNMLFVDIDQTIKSPHLLALIYGENYQICENTLPPELYISIQQVYENNKSDIHQNNIMIRADIWTLGCVLYRLLYGFDLLNNEQNHLEQILDLKTDQNINKLLEKQIDENKSFFRGEEIKEQTKNFIRILIQKCLKYDPFQRQHAIEILLMVHDFIKNKQFQENQNNNSTINCNHNSNNTNNQVGQGVFQQLNIQFQQKQLYSFQRIIKKTDSLSCVQIIRDRSSVFEQFQLQEIENEMPNLEQKLKQYEKKQEKQKQNNKDQETPQLNEQNQQIKIIQKSELELNESSSKEKEKEQQVEIFITIGGGTLIYCGKGFLLYQSPKNQQFALFNAQIESKDSIQYYTLPEVLQGSGSIQIPGPRILQGNFWEMGQFQAVTLVSGYQKNPTFLNFSAVTSLPQFDLINSWVYTQNKEDSALFQKFFSYIDQFVNEYLFPDILGNWIHCDFDSNGLPQINSRKEIEPFCLMDGNKTLLKLEHQTLIFDHTTLAYTVAEHQLQENGSMMDNNNNQQQQVSNSQAHNNYICLPQMLASLSNSSKVSEYFMEGMRFEGIIQNWFQERGVFYFSQNSRMRINDRITEKNQLYYTRIDYENNDFYEGFVLNGKYCNKGVYGNKNNKIFEGSFENDIFLEGIIYYYDDKQLAYKGKVQYDNEFNRYLRTGYGILEFKNGDIYEGEFEDDQFNGKGLFKYSGGKKGVYEGFFKDGLKEGNGSLIDDKGSLFQGIFYNGKKQFGKLTYANGEIYEGEFQNGKKDGIGIYQYVNGDVILYEGSFKDDKKQGEGVERSKDGKKYQVKYYKDQLIRRNFAGQINSNNSNVSTPLIKENKEEKNQKSSDELQVIYSEQTLSNTQTKYKFI